jgi:hypothetical protein
VGAGVFALLIAVAIAVGVIYPFTIKASTAKGKVENYGYSDVHIGSRHVFTSEWKCGEGYVVYFDFTGTINGRTVHGRICKGTPPFGGWRTNF